MGNYISASDVKSYSQISYADLGFSSDTEFDNFLNSLITQVEAVIDKYCNVPSGFFKAGGLSFSQEVYDWPEDGVIYLKHRPVLSLSSVELDMAGLNQTADWAAIDSKYYYLYPNRGILKIIGKTPGHVERSVRVTYTAGYSAVPDEIKLAALNYASNILHVILQRKIAPVVRVDEFAVRIAYGEAFTGEVKALLASYRRRFVALR